MLEVKNPAEEKVAIWAAYNQRQTSSRYRSGPPAAPPHQSLVSNTVTSREWLGSEDRRDYARGAMWGEQGAFCTNHSLYVVLRALTQLRDSEPALRYGCQHFRPVADGVTDPFGYSYYQQALLAFSRILNDRELVVVVEVANLNPVSSRWKLLFSTADPGAGDPLPISPSASLCVRVQPYMYCHLAADAGSGPAKIVSISAAGGAPASEAADEKVGNSGHQRRIGPLEGCGGTCAEAQSLRNLLSWLHSLAQPGWTRTHERNRSERLMPCIACKGSALLIRLAPSSDPYHRLAFGPGGFFVLGPGA